MTPTIGRIVIYRLGPRDVGAFPNNGADACPAIIVRTTEDDKVNLRLLNDGFLAPPWITLVEQGDDPGQWQWPVRIP